MKIDPGGGGHGYDSQIAMVSLRAGFSPLFLCLRSSRSGPSATQGTAVKVEGRQDGSSFFLSSDRPRAVHNGRGNLFFCFSIIPALPLMTRGELPRSRPLRAAPCQPAGEHIREAGSSLLLYFTDWEAVLHVEILFGAGGGALAVLQHVFPAALVR
jgi:hypothetical protein